MMKRIFLVLTIAVLAGFLASGAMAYTVNDPSNDAIGTGFESYGINMYNYTPGVNSGAIAFSLFTDYPQTGITVASWATIPADLFIRETYYGNSYLWAIPLVNHGSFTAGTLYAVGSYLISDDFDPSPGSFTYNHNVPVQIATQGNNYGNGSFGGGSVNWVSLGAGNHPDWRVDIFTGGVYQDDPNGKWALLWGTATCANDVVASAPIPGAMLLFGTGLAGLMAAGARRRVEKA
jgi:hypothetical protein